MDDITHLKTLRLQQESECIVMCIVQNTSTVFNLDLCHLYITVWSSRQPKVPVMGFCMAFVCMRRLHTNERKLKHNMQHPLNTTDTRTVCAYTCTLHVHVSTKEEYFCIHMCTLLCCYRAHTVCVYRCYKNSCMCVGTLSVTVFTFTAFHQT